uniref:Uncharacterized protein n=1 Tax=Acrobeloides nanus TaxID=290746 RepID=A0A914EH64_9BILA
MPALFHLLLLFLIFYFVTSVHELEKDIDGSGIFPEEEVASGEIPQFEILTTKEPKEKPNIVKGVLVRGKLVCAGRPLVNTRVKLYDISMGVYHALHDRLDERYTDINGDFELNGTIFSRWINKGLAEEEFQNFEAELQIFHCNDEIRPECRSFRYYHQIPQSFIQEGAPRTYFFVKDFYTHIERKYDFEYNGADKFGQICSEMANLESAKLEVSLDELL